MAKKKTIETKKKKANDDEKVRSACRAVSTEDAFMECLNQIAKTNNRIDQIVAAHDKCKSLKGL